MTTREIPLTFGQVLQRGPVGGYDRELIMVLRKLWGDYGSPRKEVLECLQPWLTEAHGENITMVWGVLHRMAHVEDLADLTKQFVDQVAWPRKSGELQALWQRLLELDSSHLNMDMQVDVLVKGWPACTACFDTLDIALPRELARQTADMAMTLAIDSAQFHERLADCLPDMLARGGYSYTYRHPWALNWARRACESSGFPRGARRMLDTLVEHGHDLDARDPPVGSSAITCLGDYLRLSESAEDDQRGHALLDMLLEAGARWQPLTGKPEMHKAWTYAQQHPKVRKDRLTTILIETADTPSSGRLRM